MGSAMLVDVTVDHVVGGPVDRASDTRLRETGFESCAAVSNLGQVVSLYIAPAVVMYTWP